MAASGCLGCAYSSTSSAPDPSLVLACGPISQAESPLLCDAPCTSCILEQLWLAQTLCFPSACQRAVDFHPDARDSSRPLKANTHKVETKSIGVAAARGNGAIDCSWAEVCPAGHHVAAVHPLPLAWCPPQRGGSAKGTERVSYHLLSDSELDNVPEQGYSSLKKEKSLSSS